MPFKRIYKLVFFLILIGSEAQSKKGYYEISFSGNYPDSICYFGITYNDMLGTPKPKSFKLNNTYKVELNGQQHVKYLFICSKVGKKEGSFIISEDDKIFVTIVNNDMNVAFSNQEQYEFYKTSEKQGVYFEDINKVNIKEFGIRNYIEKLEIEKLNREHQINISSKVKKLSESNKAILTEFSNYIFYHSFCIIFNECIPFEGSDFLGDKALTQLISKYLNSFSNQDGLKFTKFTNFNNMIHNFSRGLFIVKSSKPKLLSNEDIRYEIFNVSLKHTKYFLKDISLTVNVLENILDSSFCNVNLQKYYLHCSNSDLKDVVKNKISANHYTKNILELRKEIFIFKTSEILWEEIISKQEKSEFKAYFWASWCAACLKKIPTIVSKNIEANNEKIIFINIDSNERAWKTSTVFSQLNKLDNNYHIDPTSLMAKTLNIKYLPRSVLFDTRGNILKSFYFF